MKNIIYQTIILALGAVLIMGCSSVKPAPEDTGAADVVDDAEGSGDVLESDVVEDASPELDVEETDVEETDVEADADVEETDVEADADVEADVEADAETDE